MKMITGKNTRNTLLGLLLVGSVSYATAQTSVKPAVQAQVTQQQPQQDNEALVKQAQEFQEQQDWKSALDTWKKIETSLPDWAPVYYSEGYVYQNMKDNANAKIAYEKYLEKVKPEEIEASKKNLAYAHFFVAYSNFETNKEEAKKHIAKSLEYNPTNQDAQNLSKSLNP